MKNGKCPKCGSQDIMAEVPIIDTDQYGNGKALGLYIAEPEPAKRPFVYVPKGAGATLRAWICASCGCTELYADNLAALFESYKKGHP
jgi:predicted nucleic-acid-binding Zn-ribbon protein